MFEKHTYPKDGLQSSICILMGGRAAEEIMLNTQTTGAENDIEKAHDLARKMVCEYDMSEELGPLTFGKKEGQVFLGREFTQYRDHSEMTAKKIDEEIRDIIIGAYKKTVQLIKDNQDTLHKMANALLEKETLNSVEIDGLMAGG
jgi:cell division protease FtsH